MSGPRFFQTLMGRTYYERTLPALVNELSRLNRNLERLLAALCKDEKNQEQG